MNNNYLLLIIKNGMLFVALTCPQSFTYSFPIPCYHITGYLLSVKVMNLIIQLHPLHIKLQKAPNQRIWA